MCELLGLSSNQIENINLSLSKLAEHGTALRTYNEGWGTAYYDGLDVRLFKEAAPLATSQWLGSMRELNLESSIVIAHTRTATRGALAYRNTQPFMRELAGRMHVFAHNGDLPGIFDPTKFPIRRFSPIGETDSERAFCVLLDRLAKLWDQPHKPMFEERFPIVLQFASELRAMGPANFLYSDGELLFAHGHRRRNAVTHAIEPPGLVMLKRSCLGSDTRMMHGLSMRGKGEQYVILFASIPLSVESWQSLTEGELVAVAGGEIILRQSAVQHPMYFETSAVGPEATSAGTSVALR